MSKVRAETKLVGSGDVATLYAVESLRVVRGERRLLEVLAGVTPTSDALDEDDHDVLAELAEAIDAPMVPAPHGEHAQTIQQLNIGNTYYCNMACTYCYNELDVKARKGSEVPEGMSFETARQMVDALFAQKGPLPGVQLTFIGGESLIEKNVLYRTVDFARELAAPRGTQIGVTVYTNGVLMDDKFLAWVRENDARLIVSLDGPPSLNDRHRVFRNGRGSGKMVVRNIRRMMDALPDWKHHTVTAVLTQPSDLLPLARYLTALGFNDVQIQAAYGADGFGDRGHIADFEQLTEWYKERLLAGEVFALAPFVNILNRLRGRNRVMGNWYPCSAGRAAVGIGPDGAVYPCHHFVEEPEFKIGHVENGLPDASVRDNYFARVDRREPCKSCWARHACGGECYHRAHTAGVGYAGVMEETCNGRRDVIARVVEVFAEIAEERPDVLARLSKKDYSRFAPDARAYAADDLVPFGAAPAEARRVYLPLVSHG